MKTFIFFLILGKVFGGFNDIVENFFRLETFDDEKFFFEKIQIRFLNTE